MSTTDFKKLKVGDKLSETQYYEVAKIVGNQVQLTTDTGGSVVVDEGYVNNYLTSASQFTKEEKITKTALADLIAGYPRTAITISYQKQVKSEDVVSEIQAAYENSTPKEFATKLKKAVQNGLNGEERTIVGRHYNSKDAGGRLQFIDMNEDKTPGKDYDTRQRLVDLRTLNWAVINGVKYTVK